MFVSENAEVCLKRKRVHSGVRENQEVNNPSPFKRRKRENSSKNRYESPHDKKSNPNFANDDNNDNDDNENDDPSSV